MDIKRYLKTHKPVLLYLLVMAGIYVYMFWRVGAL